MKTEHFVRWIRTVINPQADPSHGNSAALDDFSPDGMSEFCYPKEFVVGGDTYWWAVSSAHTKRRHLCTHYEIWFFGRAFGSGMKIGTWSAGRAAPQKLTITNSPVEPILP